jgi:hypothetical protein
VGGAPTTAACDWPADSSSAFVAPSRPCLGVEPSLVRSSNSQLFGPCANSWTLTLAVFVKLSSFHHLQVATESASMLLFLPFPKR